MTRMVPRTVLVMWMASVAALGQAGVVREWQALLSTRDGMNAAEHLLKKWQPERIRLERLKSNIDKDRARLIAENRDKLRWLPWRAAGRKRLERRIANQSKAYEIANETFPRNFELDRQRILAQLRTRLLESISAYSEQNGCSLTLDSGVDMKPHTSGPEDFTSRVVQFYDATHPDALRF
jgi:hypothetical protein